MIRSITLVTHCWCPPGYDLYAQHLKWQLASLSNHPPGIEVVHLSCVSATDKATLDMLNGFARGNHLPANIASRLMIFTENELLRRAIARNKAAKKCRTQAMWFLDADYYFGEGCLDSLARQITSDTELAMPSRVIVNVDHATGDAMVEANRDVALPQIDTSLFVPLRRQIAIGGLQIVGGNVARKYGYCDGTKWTKPVLTDRGWRSTGEDKAFRRGRYVTHIDVPNLYWIRHATKGQDIDRTGQLVGRESW